jgi:hypothetical protein
MSAIFAPQPVQSESASVKLNLDFVYAHSMLDSDPCESLIFADAFSAYTHIGSSVS